MSDQAAYPQAGARAARYRKAATLAAQMGLDATQLTAAADAAWSNLNPKLVPYESALSVAAVALKAAQDVADRPLGLPVPSGFTDYRPAAEHALPADAQAAVRAKVDDVTRARRTAAAQARAASVGAALTGPNEDLEEVPDGR